MLLSQIGRRRTDPCLLSKQMSVNQLHSPVLFIKVGSHCASPRRNSFSHSHRNRLASPRFFPAWSYVSLPRFVCLVSCSEKLFLCSGHFSRLTLRLASLPQNILEEERWRGRSVRPIVKLHKKNLGRLKWAEARRGVVRAYLKTDYLITGTVIIPISYNI